MKVLQLCPLWYPVSSDSHGGIETFIAQLIPALEKFDCAITLLASGDSRTTGDLVPVILTNLNDQMKTGNAQEHIYYEQHQLQLVLARAEHYDIIHSHVGAGAFLLSALPRLKGKVLHSIHWPFYGDLEWFVRRYSQIWFNSVSEFQARKLEQAGATRCKVIYNGIDTSKFTFKRQSDHDLLFIGRMERVKGADIAIQVARQLNRPLNLAGPIIEQEFFNLTVRPYLNEKIRYIGVVDHRQKNELFGKSSCTVLPFRREEPFGLVAIESMACGTPVVALSKGAIPEIIQQGVTGYVAENEMELESLVKKSLQLDRATIRARSVEQFDISVVAEKYYRLYQEMLHFHNTMPGKRA